MNVAQNKKVEEEKVINSTQVTNGNVSCYTGNDGYAQFIWPGTITIDLEQVYDIKCIRFLLWDGLGQPNPQRDNRIYKYRLLTSIDHHNWTVIFDTSEHGYNGWQVFNLISNIRCRYIRIYGLWNSANQDFHIVEIEAHDNDPPEYGSEITF